VLLPTPEEVIAAKTAASTRFGRGEALLVPMHPPIDFAVLVAPLDLDAYCAMADDQANDLDTGNRNAVHRQLLWPAPDVFSKRLDRRPAMAAIVVGKLLDRAGRLPAISLVELLPDVLAHAPDGVASGVPGLDRAAAEKLIAAEPDRELWAVIGPGPLSLVMATPEGDVWLAAESAFRGKVTGNGAAKRVVRSHLDFALQAVVWSSEPLEAKLLADKPALALDIRTAYQTIGGSGADATSKSL
jgi:hypothetical protein